MPDDQESGPQGDPEQEGLADDTDPPDPRADDESASGRVLTPGPPVRAEGGVIAEVLESGKRFDPNPVREQTRSLLAQALVALLIVVSVLLIVFVATGSLSIDNAKDLAGTVLSPLIAVTGTALGFYFGGHRGGE